MSTKNTTDNQETMGDSIKSVKDIYQRAIDMHKECTALNEYLSGRKKELGMIKAKIVSDMDMIGVDQLRKYGAKFTVFENDGKRLIKIDLPQESKTPQT